MKIKFYDKIHFKKYKLIYCAIAGSIALFFISYNIGETLYIKNNSQSEKTVFGDTQDNIQNVSSEIIIYDKLEELSMDIINAKSRNEKIDFISTSKLVAIRSIVEKMGYNDSGYVLNVLDRWDKKDYSSVAEQHNYFYLRLNDNSKVN